MRDIILEFINNADYGYPVNVVIFQKNEAKQAGTSTVAWSVIENCIQNSIHSFTYPQGISVGVTDNWGNTMTLPATNGQVYELASSPSGNVLQFSPNVPSGSPNEVDVINNLPTGAVTVNAYRDGRLLATQPGLAAGQRAVFEFYPEIWVGIVSQQVVPGEILDSAILSQVSTQLSLAGIANAEIWLMGGGGPAAPFTFSLENVVTA